MEVRFHRLASQEFLKSLRRYRRQSERVAGRFVMAVDAALQHILANPSLCPKYDDHYRWIVLRKFPYILYFEIVGDTPIHILVVAHAKRRSGYWKKRSKTS